MFLEADKIFLVLQIGRKNQLSGDLLSRRQLSSRLDTLESDFDPIEVLIIVKKVNKKLNFANKTKDNNELF